MIVTTVLNKSGVGCYHDFDRVKMAPLLFPHILAWHKYVHCLHENMEQGLKHKRMHSDSLLLRLKGTGA